MKKRFAKKLIVIVLASVLTVCTAGVVSASDSETTITVSKEGLDEYVKELLLMLDSANTSLDQLYTEIAELDVKIAENEISLAAAEESAAYQHDQMLKRIKYFYEAGDSMDVLDAIFSADSIGDAINKSSYINRVVDYDREMLTKYKDTIASINDLQQQLIDARSRLEQAKVEFEEQNAQMLLVVSEIPEEMAEFGVDEGDVYDVIEDVREELVESGELPTEEEPETEIPTTQLIEIPTEDPTEAPIEDPTEEPTDEEPVGTNPGNFSDDEIYTMARVTYLENGCVYPTGSYRSVYLTACVILNRANNWYGGSINAAIYASGQYATAYKYDDWGGGPLNINDITWEAVYDALSNCDPNPYYQCNGDWLAGRGLTEYYRDPVTDEVFYYSYDNAP